MHFTSIVEGASHERISFMFYFDFSSKRELLMKWKLDLFDLLDEKQGSWCASGSSGVKGGHLKS